MKYFISILCLSLMVAFAFGQADPNPGEIVINEIGVVGAGTDTTEFVELFNKTANAFDLASVRLLLINGTDGLTYRTVTWPVSTLFASSTYYVIGSASTLNVNTVVWTSNGIQNGDPDAARLERVSDSAVLDAIGYYTQYDTVPGTAENGLLPVSAYEGAGGTGNGGDDIMYIQTGTAVTTNRKNTSIGRYPDGADMNNNIVDILNMFAGESPGVSNNIGYMAPPITESFNPGAGLTAEWSPSWTPILFDTISTSTPLGIPPSPDIASPLDWASVKDPTGGGDQAILTRYLLDNYNLSGFFYCGPISTLLAGDTEVGAIFGRMSQDHQNNTSGFYDIVQPIGTYGDSHYALEMDYVSGTISAIKVDKCVRTVLYTSLPVPIGWHKLEMNFVADKIAFLVDGTIIFGISGEIPRRGYSGVGYYEGSATTGTVRNNFDGFSITAPTGSVPVDLSGFVTD